jgi:NADPH:quinone reductase-like Zn-dependent oxidoreductase
LLGEVPSSVKLCCFESDLLTGAALSPLIGRILEAVRRKALALPIDPAEFSLEHYHDALEFLDSKERKGKVVVTVD